MWTQPAALLRISLYGEHRNKFTSPRMKKKAVWEILAVAMRSQGYHVSGPQCDSKRKGMLRVYKEAFANNKKSGSGRATCPYFTVLDDLLCKYPNIVPLATASSTAGYQKKSYAEQSTLSPPTTQSETTLKMNQGGSLNIKQTASAERRQPKKEPRRPSNGTLRRWT